MGILSQSPCIAAFTHIGFQDAADGASHQALMYLAMTGAIPDVPSTALPSEEAEWAMGEAIKQFAADRKAGDHPKTTLFFCGRENFPIGLKSEGQEYEWGKAMVLADTTEGKDKCVTISANASTVVNALKAVDELAEAGIGAGLLNNSTPNKPDVAAHKAALAKTGGKLVSVEDHMAIGGAGSMLASALLADGVAFQHKLLAVPGHFGQSAYMANELYDKYGIGTAGVVRLQGHPRLAPIQQ